jgi:hypothetical protein
VTKAILIYSTVLSLSMRNHLTTHLRPQRKTKQCIVGKHKSISTPISERVALKTVSVPFIDDSGRVVNGLVLLDYFLLTTLVRAGFANQLGTKGPKKSLTVDAVGGGVGTVVRSQGVHLPFAPHIRDRS